MYKSDSDSDLAEPDFKHDLKSNGLKVKGDGKILTTRGTHIDKRLHPNPRIHDLHLEAIHGGVRKYVADVCAEHDVKPLYAYGWHGAIVSPTSPAENLSFLPILTSNLIYLKRKATVILVIGEHTQDPGIFSYYDALHEVGVQKATILGLISQLSKWEHRSDVVETDPYMTNPDTPGLIVLNPGQLIYSHEKRRNYTSRSWLNRSLKTGQDEDHTVEQRQNLVIGHKDAKAHVKTFFEHILRQLVADYASLCIIAVGDAATNVVNIIDDLLIANPEHNIGTRLGLTFLIQPTHDHDKIRSPRLKNHLRMYGQSFVLNDKPIFGFIQGPTIVRVEDRQPPRGRSTAKCHQVPAHLPRALKDEERFLRRWEALRRREEAAHRPRRRHTVTSPIVRKPPYTVDSSPENMADSMSLTSAERFPLRDRPPVLPKTFYWPHGGYPGVHPQHTSSRDNNNDDDDNYNSHDEINRRHSSADEMTTESRDRVTGWVMAGPPYNDLRALGIEAFVSDFDDLNRADHTTQQATDTEHLGTSVSPANQGLYIAHRPKVKITHSTAVEAGPSSSKNKVQYLPDTAATHAPVKVEASSSAKEKIRTVFDKSTPLATANEGEQSSDADEKPVADFATAAEPMFSEKKHGKAPAPVVASPVIGTMSDPVWPDTQPLNSVVCASLSDDKPYDYSKEKVSCATVSAGPDIDHVSSILPNVMSFILKVIDEWCKSDFESAIAG